MVLSFASFSDRATATPDIRQGEHAECGLAALAILLGHHGVHVPMRELRLRAGSTLLGSTLRQLRRLAEEEGFEASARRAEPGDLEGLGLPLIVHMRFVHFAVVERVSRDAVHLNDPSSGPMVMSRQAFSRDFTGIVLRLKPRRPVRRGRRFSLVRAVIERFGPLMPLLLSAAMLAVISGGLASAGLWALAAGGTGIPVATALLALAIAVQAGAFRLAALSCRDAANGARRRVIDRLARVQDQYYLEAGTERTVALLAASRSLQETRVPAALAALLWAASALLVGSVAAPAAALPVAGLFILQIWLLLRVSHRRGSHAARHGRGTLPVRAMDADYLAEAGWYRIGRGAASLFSRLAGSHARDASQALKAAEDHVSADAAVLALDLGKIALPVSLAALAVGTGEDLPFALALAAASSAAVRFAAPGLHLRPLEDAMLRLSDIPPEPDRQDPPPAAMPPDRRLIMEHAGWSPDGVSSPVLAGLSLTLDAGEVLVAHGAPGAGATSLARLAAGMVRPTSGLVRHQGFAILVDGRRFLVPGTLRHNLGLGASHVGDDTMRRALEAVHLDTVVAPRGGLDLVLKDDRPRLSGGQIRRLMIARALCRSPDILVLDEALDNIETELAGSIIAKLRGRGLAILVTTKNRDLVGFADRTLRLGDGA